MDVGLSRSRISSSMAGVLSLEDAVVFSISSKYECIWCSGMTMVGERGGGTADVLGGDDLCDVLMGNT